jgi:hypothetical protein
MSKIIGGKHHAGDSPRILVPSFDRLVPSIDRLEDPGLTINGLTVMPTLRYRGKDATPTTWPAWGFGETLAIAGAGAAPTIGAGSNLLGANDAGPTFRGNGTAPASGKIYQGSASLGNVTTEDIVLEIVGGYNIPASGSTYPQVANKCASLFSTFSGWTVVCYATTDFSFGIRATTSTFVRGPSTVANSLYHILFFIDRSGSGICYINSSAGAPVVVSTEAVSITNSYQYGIGGYSDNSYGYGGPILYLAMWKLDNWLDTHLQPTIAANRYALLTASRPLYSFTGIASSAAKGSTSACYQTKKPTVGWLNPPAAATKSYRWKMQDGAGNLTDDLSGDSAVLTKVGTPTYGYPTTIPMQCCTRYGIYTADGDTSYFQAALAATGDQTTNDFSVSFWYYHTVQAVGQRLIIQKRSSGGAYPGWGIYLSISTLGIYISTPALGNVTGAVSGALAVGWHFITVNFDRDGNATTIVDGVATGITTDISARASTITNTGLLKFFRADTATLDVENAALSEVMISNGLTTLSEHQAAYLATQSRLGAGAPRYNQVLDANGRTFVGSLVEAASENKCLQSDDLATTWTQGNLTTISANGALASDGLSTLDGLVASALNNNHYVRQSITLTVANWVMSCEVRAGNKNWVGVGIAAGADNRYVCFNLNTASWGTIGAGVVNYGVFNYGGGLFKLWLTFVGSAAALQCDVHSGQADGLATFAGDAATVNTWFGAVQVELGNYPSSRNPTTTTALTRAADSTYYTLAAGTLSDSEGALFLQFVAPVFTPGRSHYLASLSAAGVATNSVTVFLDTNGRVNVATASTAGADTGSVLESSGTRCDNVIHEVLVTWIHNNLKLYVDNVLIGSDTAVDPPAGLTRLQIGADVAAANQAGPVLVDKVQSFATSTNYRIVR